MRILYLTMNFPYGNGEAFFIPEINELLNQGHEIIIAPRSPSNLIVNKDGYELKKVSIKIPIISANIIAVAILYLFTHPVILSKLILTNFKSRNIIVFLKNLIIIPKAIWLARYAKRNKIDHIHSQWALTTATLAMYCSIISKIAWSFTGHRADILEDNLLRVKLENAKFVRFISLDGIKTAFSIVNKSFPTKVFNIHMGVNIPNFDSQIKPESVITNILWPANFEKYKGHLIFLQAFHILKSNGVNFKLYLAGDGSLRQSVMKEINRLNIKSEVNLLGFIPHNELLSKYAERFFDIVVLPSLHEGIPVSLIEAMSYKIPVIATDVGGIKELLEENAGILIPSKNVKIFAEELTNLIENKELRKDYGLAGRKKVEIDFNVKRTMLQFSKLIQTST
jgi:colanic acid/amylovoran biosynthesis glycosyltransferase